MKMHLLLSASQLLAVCFVCPTFVCILRPEWAKFCCIGCPKRRTIAKGLMVVQPLKDYGKGGVIRPNMLQQQRVTQAGHYCDSKVLVVNTETMLWWSNYLKPFGK